jgi:hypothetical protein
MRSIQDEARRVSARNYGASLSLFTPLLSRCALFEKWLTVIIEWR